MAGTNAQIGTASAATKSQRRAMLAEFWYYFSQNRGAVIGLYVFVAIVIVAVLAPLIAPHSPSLQNRGSFLVPPVWEAGGDWRFLLGTDAVGRDILSRLIYGARFSLFIGAVVVTLSVSVGVIIGLIAGYFRGWVDTVITRVMDIILAFPSLLLALVLVAILGPGLLNAMIAIALVLQPHFVRLTRAAVMSEKTRDYVTAARVAGAGNIRLMFRTILPNCLAPLIVVGTVQVAHAIALEATLSFLGVGLPQTEPSLGLLISNGFEYMLSGKYWISIFPGVALLLTIVSINLVGDQLRDVLNPRLRR